MGQYDPSHAFEVTVATAGTAVEFGLQPWDTTHTITFYNATANTVWVAWQTTNAAITQANGTPVPAGGAFTLPIGRASERTSSGGTLWADASGNGTAFSVTYIQGAKA